MAQGSLARRTRHELIEAYKTVLKDCIDQRPSGMRRRIAEVLGTHKSFISQITNPSDPTPIPSRHLDTIFDVCHLSPPERERFLEAYREAHPAELGTDEDSRRHYRTLHIQVPVLRDPSKQRALEALLREIVRRIGDLLEER
jgi:hypothetical protein